MLESWIVDLEDDLKADYTFDTNRALTIAEILKETRAELKTILEPVTDDDLDKHIRISEGTSTQLYFIELKRVRAELKTLRDHRYYASALIDCENRCKKFREALEKISKEVGSVCGGDDAWEIAQEVLK